VLREHKFITLTTASNETHPNVTECTVCHHTVLTSQQWTWVQLLQLMFTLNSHHSDVNICKHTPTDAYRKQ